MWDYNETPDFIRSSEELNLSQKVRDSIKAWAVSVKRQITNRSKLYFRSPNNIFEIWNARLPDPDSNKGTKGGFRLTYFFNLADNSINLGEMERRDKLGGRRERPRDHQKYENYLKELKKYLLRELDPSESCESGL